MKKFCAFLALVLSLVFAGATLAQDKPAATPDKPAAAAAAAAGAVAAGLSGAAAGLSCASAAPANANEVTSAINANSFFMCISL